MDKRRKFTKEEKIAIVKKYLKGSIGCTSLAREVGCAKSKVLYWSYGYKEHGSKFFREDSKQRSYSKEFKIQAVNNYFTNGSTRKAAAKAGISERVLLNWIKAYNDGTLEESNPMSEVYHMKGRRTTFEERKEIVHYCLERDKNYKETAKTYSLPYSRVYTIVNAYIKFGEEGIMDAKAKKESKPLTEVERLQKENERLKKEVELEKLKRELIQKKISLEKERLQEFKRKTHIKP